METPLIKQLLIEEEQTLRRFFEQWVKSIYRINVSAGTVDKIIFDFYSTHEKKYETPPYSAVLLVNSYSKVCDIIGFIEYDFADCAFTFFPKYGAQRIPIN